MRVVNGNPLGIISVHVEGPWTCEQCGQLSQFAERTSDKNVIFCKNERCRFKRIVDKRHHRILEADGSIWEYEPVTGRKRRIR